MQEYVLDQTDDLWQSFAHQIDKVSWNAGAFLAKRMLNDQFSDWERVIVLTDEDQLVGFCAVVKEDVVEGTGLAPFIGFVFVNEQYRGHHLSQRLVRDAESQIAKIGFHQAYIVTAHVGLYEKLGYQQIDTQTNIFGRPMRVLAKKIAINDNKE